MNALNIALALAVLIGSLAFPIPGTAGGAPPAPPKGVGIHF